MVDNIGQTLKVNELIKLIVNYSSAVYSGSGSFKDVQPTMLWSSPGIGKSQAMGQIAKELGQRFNKKTVVRDVRLLLCNPIDLRGIPIPAVSDDDLLNNPSPENVAKLTPTVAKWLKPEIFNLNPSDDYLNFLILDEISSAPPTVQACAYQITLDRQVGEHRIPDNTMIMCAGNEVTDKSVAYKMPKALSNRLSHLKIKADVDDWKSWAIPNGINNMVIGYLNYQNSQLHSFDPNSDDNAFPTPRSWEKVSSVLKYISIDDAMPLISGLVGEGNGYNFYQYTKLYSKLPNLEAILDGNFKSVPVPKSPDVMFALCSALTSKALKCENTQLENIVKYCMLDDFSGEFAVLLIRDILKASPNIQGKLVNTSTFTEFTKKYSFILGISKNN